MLVHRVHETKPGLEGTKLSTENHEKLSQKQLGFYGNLEICPARALAILFAFIIYNLWQLLVRNDLSTDCQSQASFKSGMSYKKPYHLGRLFPSIRSWCKQWEWYSWYTPNSLGKPPMACDPNPYLVAITKKMTSRGRSQSGLLRETEATKYLCDLFWPIISTLPS